MAKKTRKERRLLAAKKAKVAAAKISESLETWRTMMDSITKMSEAELEAALNQEISKPKEEQRQDLIVRLHRRFTRIRKERELEEYLS